MGEQEYVLNTHTGVLHTKECADGKTGLEPVAAGRRQHFNNRLNATESSAFRKVHKDCMK